MIKIIISNITNLNNKGSMARVQGLINCINIIMPQSNIILLHRYYDKDKDSNVKELKNKYHNLTIKRHPWLNEKNNSAFTIFYSLTKLFINVVWIILLNLLRIKRNDLYKSNIIIDLNVIEPTENVYFTMTIGAYLTLLNIWYSTLFRKPVMICSATIGPYKDKLLQHFAKYIFNKVNIITLREELSKSYLEFLKVSKPMIYSSADLAYLMEAENSQIITVIFQQINLDEQDRPIIGITPTAMTNPSLSTNEYIQVILDVSDYLINNFDATIIYITNTYQDIVITEKLYKKINRNDKVKVLPSFYTASEIKGVIGKCDIFISSRLHALIASTSLTIPSIGLVSYSKGKFHGIVGDMMGLNNYLLDIDENFEYNKFIELLKLKIVDLWHNRNYISDNLKTNEKSVKEKVLLNGYLIKQLVNQ